MKESKWMKALGAVLSAVIVMYPVADAYGVLNVPISRSVTVEAVVSATNILNIALKNISDDQVATKIVFSNTTGVGTASQYIEVDFSSNAVGAKIIVRTDNKNNTPAYTGTGEGAGLVGSTDTKTTAPLLWIVYDDLAATKAFVFKGDTDPDGTGKGTLPGATPRPAGEAEGLVVDKNNAQYESSGVQGYATVVVPQGTTGLLGNFPVAGNPQGGMRSCTSPIYVALGAGFSGMVAQTYSTNTLALDLVVQ